MIAENLHNILWNGQNPFANFPHKLIAPDMQGWTSQHVFLTDSIQEIKPKIIVEIGVWKGGSTMTMAHKLKELKLDAAVISVDTWLGAWDHWVNPQWKEELCFMNGYPRLFEKFQSNVLHNGLQDFVVPLPLDSVNAAQVVNHFGISADIIHIDGGHDYAAVSNDLHSWWKILRPGGILILDDYVENGTHWPEVFSATNDFLAKAPHSDFQAHGGKCRLTKI